MATASLTDLESDAFSKELDTALLAARGFVILDNVRGEVSKGGKLIALLTAAEINIRLYHTQQFATGGAGTLVLITANNAKLDGEIGRRVVKLRIDTGRERPDRIVYTFDPRDEVLRDRGRMVIDALTIMRAYVVAGRPKQAGVSMGSFEDWSRIVRDPLLWIGLQDIGTSSDESFEGNAETEQLDAMVDAWKEWGLLDGHYTTGRIVELAKEREPEGAEGWQRTTGWEGPPPFRRSSLREACLAVAEKAGARGTISKERLGRWLSSYRGRVRRGYMLSRQTVDGRAEYSLKAL